ncbi:MAG TPA: hypothetical protein VHE54_06950 [Puia sp.]|nr:hypothetical protein [Puia sp.]
MSLRATRALRRKTCYFIQCHVHPVIRVDGSAVKRGAGKQKDVFTKKQVLILFDLLTSAARVEPIDFRKQNSFPKLAALLHALTGHVCASWLAELKDYKTRGLYDCYTAGEKNQLVATLTNLAETFRCAGFANIATAADKKMRELEARGRSLQ